MSAGTHRRHQQVLALIASIVGVAVATQASGVSFTVVPVHIRFSRHVSTRIVTITNASESTQHFSVKAFAWNHGESGDANLTPSTDVRVSPEAVTIPPAGASRVQVGTMLSPASAERSFRIVIEELAPERAASVGNSRVTLRTRVLLPVFVDADNPAPRAELTDIAYRHGFVSARIRNTGNTHVVVGAVEFRGGTTLPKGRPFEREVQGWYVLPGRSLVVRVPMSREECLAAGHVAVTANVDDRALRLERTLSPERCTEF